MKNRIFIFISLLLILLIPGCAKIPSGTVDPNELPVYRESFAAVEKFGEVPEEFGSIVSENTFYGVKAFGDRLLGCRTVFAGDTDPALTGGKTLLTLTGYVVTMYDTMGNKLGEQSESVPSYYTLDCLEATSDGGFLYVLGFSESYLNEEQRWASESGIVSKIIKCDSHGNKEWQYDAADYDYRMLEYFIEHDGYYYFFGESQDLPKNKSGGYGYSYTDVHAMKMSADGKIIESATFGGSDFDGLSAVRLNGNGFLMTVSSQSGDGDFPSGRKDGCAERWNAVLTTDLELKNKEMIEGWEYDRDYTVGILDGRTVSSSDPIFENNENGSVTALIDYGDFYLVISENKTGIYPSPPTVSATWYYTETVYSAYGRNGELLWRDAVDSTYGVRIID